MNAEQSYSFIPSEQNADIITPDRLAEIILNTEGVTNLQLMTMAYHPTEGNAGKIHNHLLHLSEQGVDTSLYMDAMYNTYLVPHTDYIPIISPFLIGKLETEKRLQQREIQFQQLDNSKVNVHLTGKSETRKLFPFRNVDHRKILLAQNGVNDFGVVFGCNINYQLEKRVMDSGTYFDDPEILDWLRRYINTPHFSDPSLQTFKGGITLFTRELTDAGNQIMDGEILHMIDKAKSNIMLISQFLPDGKILNSILAAMNRGVKVDLISNSPFYPRQHLYMLHRKIGTLRLKRIVQKNEGLTFYTPQDDSNMVHMKGLVVDDADPYHASAITGTDCMTNEMLKRFGTREVSIRFDDFDTVQNYTSYLADNILENCTEFDFSRI